MMLLSTPEPLVSFSCRSQQPVKERRESLSAVVIPGHVVEFKRKDDLAPAFDDLVSIKRGSIACT